jgi:hypothetical protein
MIKYVYIAGPYTNGGVVHNIQVAIDWAETIMERGFIPYIPHLTHLWDIYSPHPYDEWLEFDLHWLDKCDAVFRIVGESVGADKEVEYAKEHNIPVFDSVPELMKYAKEQK